MSYYPSREDKELRQIAMDIADNKILTSHQVPGDMWQMVFMPIVFGAFGPIPVAAKCLDDTGEENLRKDAVYPIVQMGSDEMKDMMLLKTDDGGEHWFMKERFEIEESTDHLKDVGMVFEYYDKAGPRAINGYPCFFSLQILNTVDTEKVWAMAKPLLDMKQQFVETGEIDGD